jgi:hypothetical protein
LNLKGLITQFNLKWLLALVFISACWVNLNHERWAGRDVIRHDIVNYYSYLPATFIEKDLTLSFLKKDGQRLMNEHADYWPNKAPNGNYVIKMSMGMALSYLPFFGMAHLYAKLFGYPATGFSQPYHFAVQFSSVIYFIIGLIFLWKALTRLLPSGPSLFTLFCLCFGTNVFYYLTIGGGLSHTVGFTLCAIFLYLTLRWQQGHALKYTLLLGLTGGLLILVRPINGLAFVFFFLYDSHTPENNREIRSLIKTKFLHMALMMVVSGLVLVPQMLYWKYVTGHYVFNSYVGERFYFNNPHVFYGLFSFRKGWLLYTPIMLLALIGFFYLKGSAKRLQLPLLLFFLVYIYVCFSWWCWWYGGSFGQRALIDIYPFLAVPFAALMAKVAESKVAVKRSVYTLSALFIVLNLFQTTQAKYNIIDYDAMTRENYFRVFFTITKKPDREKYLKHPNTEAALRGEEEY